ncbi:MAG: site-specific integrase [Acidobacteria bacterium]|nr:site-specific integrase [Acidobacteriota bacterium]
MGVKQEWSDKHNREVWGYDARIGIGDRRRRVRRFGFSSRAAAEIALSKARVTENERRAGVIPEEPPAVITLRQLIEVRVKGMPVPKGTPGYYSRNQAIGDLERFLSMTDGEMPVEQLSTAHVARYRDARLASGLQPQTVFREITNLQACFNSAREHFPELETWRPPQRPKLRLPKGQREATFAPEDVARLLAYLRRPREATHARYSREPARAYRARLAAADSFQIALQTAGRSGEVYRLRWADVLWHKGALRVDSTKLDEEGVIFLPDSLMELLRRRRDAQVGTPGVWVFPSDLCPERHVSRGYTSIIRQAAIELGIPWGYETPGGVVFHTTRHTATTAMLDAGNDLPTVQAQTRHSDKTMLMRYGHASARSRRAAVTALDQFAPAEAEEGQE